MRYMKHVICYSAQRYDEIVYFGRDSHGSREDTRDMDMLFHRRKAFPDVGMYYYYYYIKKWKFGSLSSIYGGFARLNA